MVAECAPHREALLLSGPRPSFAWAGILVSHTIRPSSSRQTPTWKHIPRHVPLVPTRWREEQAAIGLSDSGMSSESQDGLAV